MIIRKSDLTENALQLGVWESLCNMAQVAESEEGDVVVDELSIDVVSETK